jgi:hypothetical protein
VAGRRCAGTLPGMSVDGLLLGGFNGLLMTVLSLGALALAAWALLDALIRPAAGYVAAGKLTKPGWGAILALSLLVLLIGPMSFLGLPAVIAAIVYLVDVRPAVRGLRRGGSGW